MIGKGSLSVLYVLMLWLVPQLGLSPWFCHWWQSPSFWGDWGCDHHSAESSWTAHLGLPLEMHLVCDVVSVCYDCVQQLCHQEAKSAVCMHAILLYLSIAVPFWYFVTEASVRGISAKGSSWSSGCTSSPALTPWEVVYNIKFIVINNGVVMYLALSI